MRAERLTRPPRRPQSPPRARPRFTLTEVPPRPAAIGPGFRWGGGGSRRGVGGQGREPGRPLQAQAEAPQPTKTRGIERGRRGCWGPGAVRGAERRQPAGLPPRDPEGRAAAGGSCSPAVVGGPQLVRDYIEACFTSVTTGELGF